jgi:hypothetical protein
MGLTRNDWRTLKVAAIALVPLEIGALRVLERIPFDIEPITQPTMFEELLGLAVVVLHYPALRLGVSGDIPARF